MSQPRFKFTGELSLPNATAKKPFCKLFEKNGQKMASMNLGVKESKNNIGFVELFGSIPEKKVIKTKDTDGNDIEINWEDRANEDTVKTVAYYRKYIVDLGEDLGGRQEFISPYDAILFLKENLPQYKGNICILGQMKREWYAPKERFYDKFEFQSVYAVDSEEKKRLIVTADIFYRKDCVDKESWKSDKIILLDGYVEQYIKDEKATKLVPMTFVFNASKIDPENERHKKLLDYKLKYVDSKSKKWGHLLWETFMINGAEEVEFDESQLTDAQKEQIELGLKTIDDFKPNGSIYGERKNEYRLVVPSLIESGNDDFRNGFIELDETDSEFEERIFVPIKDEKFSDVMKEAEKEEDDEEETKEVEIDEDMDDEDLFS